MKGKFEVDIETEEEAPGQSGSEGQVKRMGEAWLSGPQVSKGASVGPILEERRESDDDDKCKGSVEWAEVEQAGEPYDVIWSTMKRKRK